MKFVLLTITVFHFANFGEAQVTTSPLIPDYCDCAIMWIGRTMKFSELSGTVRPRQLARKIFRKWDNEKWDNDGCFDILDLGDMFYVSQ